MFALKGNNDVLCPCEMNKVQWAMKTKEKDRNKNASIGTGFMIKWQKKLSKLWEDRQMELVHFIWEKSLGLPISNILYFKIHFS